MVSASTVVITTYFAEFEPVLCSSVRMTYSLFSWFSFKNRRRFLCLWKFRFSRCSDF